MNQSRDEQELLQGFNDRNIHAIRELYYSVIKKACLIAFRIVKDPSIAEEIANDAIHKTIQSPIKFGTIQKAQNYIYIITRNKSLNHIRSPEYKQRPSFYEELPDIRDNTDIEASIHYAEIIKEIKEQTEKLPPNHQLIIKLYEEGKKTSEIARIVNKEKQYVLNIKNKVKKFILKYLRDRDDFSG